MCEEDRRSLGAPRRTRSQIGTMWGWSVVYWGVAELSDAKYRALLVLSVCKTYFQRRRLVRCWTSALPAPSAATQSTRPHHVHWPLRARTDAHTPSHTVSRLSRPPPHLPFSIFPAHIVSPLSALHRALCWGLT